MPYVFAGLIGLVALVFALLKATKRLKETEAMIEKSHARRQAQVDRIKRVARTTLHQRRELNALNRRKAATEFACEELEQKLNASRALDRRIYVLDERKHDADQPFTARVSNSDYAVKVNSKLERTALENWRRGRRFLIWAHDEAKAREKINARFPEHKGFHLQSLEAAAHHAD